MRWMEERIGYERCKGAYAFKRLQDAGSQLAFGSAFATFEEDIKGQIKPGMLADIAVVDTDLFETEPGQ